MHQKRTAVIGLDGATFQILRAYCDKGLMPNMKAFMEDGVSADLLSTIPPITGPAWAAFMTGKDPSNTGIHDWMSTKHFRWDSNTSDRQMQFINSGLLKHKTLWEIVSEGGGKSIVLNVPLTYPVRPVDGVVVSGFLTPDENCAYTHPAEVKDEIASVVGDYRINITHSGYQKTATGIGRYFRDLTEMTKKRTELALHLLDTRDWDFFMLVYIGTDRTQHWLWEYVSGEGGDVPGAEDMVHEYYRFLDDCIGRLLAKTGRDTPTYFVSDHGFTKNRGSFLMNRWLMSEGFLEADEGASGVSGIKAEFYGYVRNRLGRSAIAALETLGLTRYKMKIGRLMNPGEVIIAKALETPGSRAVLLMPFTLKLRRTEDPREFEATRQEIIGRMRALMDPETGEPVFEMVERPEDVFTGAHVSEMSDILFLFRESRYIATPNMPVDAVNGFIAPPGPWDTGAHRMEGIFIARGAGIKKSQTLPPLHIEDAAPTMLYRMGLDIPEDMDGRVAAGIFEDGFVNSHALVRSGESGLDLEGGLDEEEDEKVRESLESLGYL